MEKLLIKEEFGREIYLDLKVNQFYCETLSGYLLYSECIDEISKYCKESYKERYVVLAPIKLKIYDETSSFGITYGRDLDNVSLYKVDREVIAIEHNLFFENTVILDETTGKCDIINDLNQSIAVLPQTNLSNIEKFERYYQEMDCIIDQLMELRRKTFYGGYHFGLEKTKFANIVSSCLKSKVKSIYPNLVMDRIENIFITEWDDFVITLSNNEGFIENRTLKGVVDNFTSWNNYIYVHDQEELPVGIYSAKARNVESTFRTVLGELILTVGAENMIEIDPYSTLEEYKDLINRRNKLIFDIQVLCTSGELKTGLKVIRELYNFPNSLTKEVLGEVDILGENLRESISDSIFDKVVDQLTKTIESE